MNAIDAFIDTNILLYLLSGDTAKANRAEELIAAGGVISKNSRTPIHCPYSHLYWNQPNVARRQPRWFQHTSKWPDHVLLRIALATELRRFPQASSS